MQVRDEPRRVLQGVRYEQTKQKRHRTSDQSPLEEGAESHSAEINAELRRGWNERVRRNCYTASWVVARQLMNAVSPDRARHCVLHVLGSY